MVHWRQYFSSNLHSHIWLYFYATTTTTKIVMIDITLLHSDNLKCKLLFILQTVWEQTNSQTGPIIARKCHTHTNPTQTIFGCISCCRKLDCCERVFFADCVGFVRVLFQFFLFLSFQQKHEWTIRYNYNNETGYFVCCIWFDMAITF